MYRRDANRVQDNGESDNGEDGISINYVSLLHKQFPDDVPCHFKFKT